MIGILLITHGSLGESLIQCACHVMNRRPPQLLQLGVSGQDDPLDTLPLARQLLDMVDTGEGVLIHGGERTPFGAGDLLFVAAGVDHHYTDFSDDLSLWRIFYGETGGEIPM